MEVALAQIEKVEQVGDRNRPVPRDEHEQSERSIVGDRSKRSAGFGGERPGSRRGRVNPLDRFEPPVLDVARLARFQVPHQARIARSLPQQVAPALLVTNDAHERRDVLAKGSRFDPTRFLESDDFIALIRRLAVDYESRRYVL